MENRKAEVWKPVYIKEVTGLYEISNHGRVKSLRRERHTPHGGLYIAKEKILTLTRTHNGYLSVTLSNKPFNKSFFVHILIATLFVDNANNEEFVNHENGNKQDNYYENLKWCTRSYNMLHAFNTGLIPTTRNRKKKASIEIPAY